MSQNASLSSSSKCASSWAMERERRRPFTEPIEIPAAASADDKRAASRREWEDHHPSDDDGEVMPPHVLLARRRAAFSMCSGQGRTLKGRDLRRVRESVLRMTGFIES
ncbi:hypothetical protein EJB05_52952, partial [Eragrostis curvula]